MHCPVCKDPKLVITDRQGIEIDYCPDCRGVWLDRGELDKLIEKSMAASAPPAQPAGYESRPEPRQEQRYEHKYDSKYNDKYDKHSGYRKKPKSWLSEFFD